MMVKATMPFILNTVRKIFMRLYGSVEEVVTICLVYKIWQLLCSYSPPPTHTHKKKALVLISPPHVGSKTRLLGQILEKFSVPSRRHKI